MGTLQNESWTNWRKALTLRRNPRSAVVAGKTRSTGCPFDPTQLINNIDIGMALWFNSPTEAH